MDLSKSMADKSCRIPPNYLPVKVIAYARGAGLLVASDQRFDLNLNFEQLYDASV